MADPDMTDEDMTNDPTSRSFEELGESLTAGYDQFQENLKMVIGLVDEAQDFEELKGAISYALRLMLDDDVSR